MNIKHAVLLSLLGNAFGCQQKQGATAAQDRCTSPDAPTALDPRDSLQRAGWLTWASSLQYESGADPTGENRDLTERQAGTPPTWRLGPQASIEPNQCAYKNSATDLNGGRVIARIDSRRAYPKLKLMPGINYLYVVRYNEGTGGAWALVVPETGNAPLDSLYLMVRIHTGYHRLFSEARWLFDPGDDHLWVSCVQYGCCQSHPAPGDTSQMDG
jgi:hypothetical protein